MHGAVTRYESPLIQFPPCADPWFAEQIAAYRAGDESAWRSISGSCLSRVLEIAKRKWQPGSSLGLLDLAQEGNRVLERTIKHFQGDTAAEFLAELTNRVEERLTLVVEHPDLLRGLRELGVSERG